jgi:hypothetical protein
MLRNYIDMYYIDIDTYILLQYILYHNVPRGGGDSWIHVSN